MTASILRAAPSGRAAGLRPQPPAGSSRSSIPAAQDIDLTAIIRREKIGNIGVYGHRISVTLIDGSLGIGASVGEALDKAKLPGAENVRRVA